MKTKVGLIIMTVLLASCVNHYCPTYSRSKSRPAPTASSKKAKPSKTGATPYYKTLRVAESDASFGL